MNPTSGSPDGPLHVRVWFRRLVGELWGALLRPSYFHTWIEIVDADDAPPEPAPLAVGIYEKEVDGEGRAVVMSQDWEYESEQLDRFDPGYVFVELPGLTTDDLATFRAMRDEDRRDDLGPYAFLGAWSHLWGRDEVNCMTWVEEFVRSRRGPEEILRRVELAFGERLRNEHHQGRRH